MGAKNTEITKPGTVPPNRKNRARAIWGLVFVLMIAMLLLVFGRHYGLVVLNMTAQNVVVESIKVNGIPRLVEPVELLPDNNLLYKPQRIVAEFISYYPYRLVGKFRTKSDDSAVTADCELNDARGMGGKLLVVFDGSGRLVCHFDSYADFYE